MANENYILETTHYQNALDSNKYDPIFALEAEEIHRMGILRSTRETTLYIDIVNNKVVFRGAWEIHCGESYSYKESELEEFESDHKGLLADIQDKLNNNKVMFRYFTWNGTKNEEHITADLNEVMRHHKTLTMVNGQQTF